MKTINRARRSRWALGLVPVLIGAWIAGAAAPALAHTWTEGDIFVAVSDGKYEQYNAAGSGPTDVFQVGTAGRPDGGFTTGCAMNPAGFPAGPVNLYTTAWAEKKVVVVPDGSHTPLTSIDTTLAGTSGRPESIVFNTVGEFYVGMVDSAPLEPNLLKYSAAHALLATYVVPVGGRGVDAIDLAADQDNIYFTSEDSNVYRYTISTNTRTTFASGLTRAYGLRLLQGGNTFGQAGGTGFLMVADTNTVRVLDAGGATINQYDSGTHNGWFSVSIDAGGAQFVAGDFYSGDVVKFNANGTVATTFNADPRAFFVNGVCVKGEVTTGVVPFPSEGFFVVGDINAGYPTFSGLPANGNNVVFWGSQWKANNSFTLGNSANASFKGFAENTVPPTPFCGSTFTSKGGNSDPPNVLPPRVAVIVTTQVTDPPGSNQGAGVVKAIVLVDVVGGTYNGAPGGDGAGKIVQVICSIP